MPARSLKLNRNTLYLTAIILVGAALRFFHLGYNSLWLDEAGVAYAARAENLAKMLEVVRSHVLAMPLDYLIVWLVGRFSASEAALRIPAALWGIASLLLAYRLFRRFIKPGPALLAVLILALSPLHIRYSQELRFYASLVFFYLLATLLLWDAFQQPSRVRWVWFTAACIIGIYFHPYVLFALANGVVWLAFYSQKTPEGRKLRIHLLFSATLCLLAFLVGYLIFSTNNPFQIPLMAFERSPVQAIAEGFGWLPFYPIRFGWDWLWGILCMVLEIIGVVSILKTSWRSLLAGLFYSLLLQTAVVFSADWIQHYFFAPRQLLMLLPTWCLFAGIGVKQVLQSLTRLAHSALPRILPTYLPRVIAALTILVVLFCSLPAILSYQRDDKGATRAISQEVTNEWKPGDSVFIYPAYNGFVYKYYLEDVYNREDIASRLWGMEWGDIINVKHWDGTIFLFTPSQLSSQEDIQLKSSGYIPRAHSYPLSRNAATLWVRLPDVSPATSLP